MGVDGGRGQQVPPQSDPNLRNLCIQRSFLIKVVLFKCRRFFVLVPPSSPRVHRRCPMEMRQLCQADGVEREAVHKDGLADVQVSHLTLYCSHQAPHILIAVRAA